MHPAFSSLIAQLENTPPSIGRMPTTNLCWAAKWLRMLHMGSLRRTSAPSMVARSVRYWPGWNKKVSRSFCGMVSVMATDPAASGLTRATSRS